MPRNNPHLSPEGIDFRTKTHHCLGCEEPVVNALGPLQDHIHGAFHHFITTKFPGILATDDRGMTIENVWRVPARIVLAPVSLQSHASICVACFPEVKPSGCGGCGSPVDTTKDYTASELLTKQADGYNHSYRSVIWHIDCLPEGFDDIKTLRDQRREALSTDQTIS